MEFLPVLKPLFRRFPSVSSPLPAPAANGGTLNRPLLRPGTPGIHPAAPPATGTTHEGTGGRVSPSTTPCGV